MTDTAKDRGSASNVEDDLEMDDDNEDEDEADESQRRSLKQSWQQLQNILTEIQNASGLMASFLEKVWNLFCFTNPFLSLLLGLAMGTAALVLWFLGLR